ncbi:MAG: SAM-dependent chlorinase/fluorinase [Nitrospirota bacterium]
MQNNPVITLTTDFGYKDPFVGVMKGIILRINPSVNIIDITHEIAPYNIMEAALTIGVSYEFFPNRTIHVVVVDPGVGSDRRPILVVGANYYFIGPDNGVFSYIYNIKQETLEVIHITSEHYFMPQRGPTFHGRDIFAPVAAWLSKGIDISEFGEPIADYINLYIPVPIITKENTIEGEVIFIDRFGNAITNIRTQEIGALYSINPEGSLEVLAKGKQIPLKDYYSQVEDKGLYSLINSSGYLELFVCQGNASKDFGIAVGDRVSLKL